MSLGQRFAKTYFSSWHGILPYCGARGAKNTSLCWKVNTALEGFALRASENFSAQDWEDIQLTKTRHLLLHANSSVPYWNRVFAEVGFDPRQFRNLSDLAALPISTRAQLKQLPVSDLCSRSIPQYRAVPGSTSGSTGEPFSVYRDAYDIYSREAEFTYILRFAGGVCKRPFLILGLQTHISMDRMGKRFSNYKVLQDASRRHEELYPFLLKERPSILRSTATLVRLFAETVERDRFPYRFDYILSSSESLSDVDRAYVEKVLGGRVIGLYGSRECGSIAMECVHRAMHVDQWRAIMEIVDEHGNSVRPGEEGRILLTNLENEVMPLIRYEMGDRGRMSYDPCPCGHALPVISVSGRTSASIELPSGKTTAVLAINTYLAKKFNARMRQFQIENKQGELLIRVVPAAEWREEDGAKLRKGVAKLIYGEKPVVLESVPVIPPSASGKTPLFINASGVQAQIR